MNRSTGTKTIAMALNSSLLRRSVACAGMIFIAKEKKEKIVRSTSVYIAENDKAVRENLADGLGLLGFDTRLFDSGYPIVSMMDNWPDIFVIDIQLPGINGLEVCKWLKSHESSRSIPVILLSPDPYLRILAASTHADDYIDKPFVVKELIAHIRACLVMEQTGTA